MIVKDVIIDDVGHVFAAGSGELVSRYDAYQGEFSLENFLVRNSGHIRLRVSSLTIGTRITFQPGSISVKTVERVIELLFDQPVNRYVIDLIGPDPQMVMVTDFDDLVAMIINYAESSSPFRRPEFFVQPLSLKRLKLDPRLTLLQTIYNRWLFTRSKIVSIKQALTVEPADAQQLSVQIRGNTPVIEDIGSGYKNIKQDVDRVKGSRVDDLSDQAYGDWIARCLTQVARTGEPILQLVEATISLSGSPSTRIRYERLLLPWASRGDIAVSSASVTRTAFRRFSRA